MILLPEKPELERPPRIRKVEAGGDIEDALLGVELVKNYLINPYDWQTDILTSWLAADERGKYIHPTCGAIIGRQNGKSTISEGRMLVGAIFYGEKIRYTAHRVDTMLQQWNIMVELFGDTRRLPEEWKYPELHQFVDRMTHTNGHQSIKLINGGELFFGARSTGGGRGNTIDVIIYDEAQYLTDTQQSNDLPSISAGPRKNPQVIYIGTPPDYQESFGESFGKLRQSVIEGDAPGIAWHEWSTDKIGDVSDRKRWYAANPALGHSLIESAIANEFYTMSPRKFAQERLAYWAEPDTVTAINAEEWAETASDGYEGRITKFCVGIKFAPNGAQTSMSTGVLLDDGTTYCELVMNETVSKSKTEFVNWIVERKDKISLIVIDGKSGADEMAGRLLKEKVSKHAIKILGSREVITAATMLNSDLEERTLRHHTDKVLDESAAKSVKRKIGQDGYGFGSEYSIPLESLSFANWAAKTTRRDPEPKKMRLI